MPYPFHSGIKFTLRLGRLAGDRDDQPMPSRHGAPLVSPPLPRGAASRGPARGPPADSSSARQEISDRNIAARTSSGATASDPAEVSQAPVRMSTASTWISALHPAFLASCSTVGGGPAGTASPAATAAGGPAGRSALQAMENDRARIAAAIARAFLTTPDWHECVNILEIRPSAPISSPPAGWEPSPDDAGRPGTVRVAGQGTRPTAPTVTAPAPGGMTTSPGSIRQS